MTAREELVEAIRKARKVQVGNVLYIGNDAEINAAIRRGLARGDTVVENGVSQWIEVNEVYDQTKAGSAAYTWRGDKVKCERVLMVKLADGTVHRGFLGYTWRNL